jgi:hypothetical protein
MFELFEGNKDVQTDEILIHRLLHYKVKWGQPLVQLCPIFATLLVFRRPIREGASQHGHSKAWAII